MHNSGADQSLKMRIRLELTTGRDERVAEYDVTRELTDVLGGYATPETEQRVLEFLQREVLNGARGLLRARMARERADDPTYFARITDHGLDDGVDAALASLEEGLRTRQRI